jgi:L-fuconolactonase
MGERHTEDEEPILEPEIPIIDAHHHLYDGVPVKYMFKDLLSDISAGHNITAAVYVETQAMARADGPEELRPIGEVEFANGVAAMSASGAYGPCRVAAAIVGYADLSLGDRAAETLDRAIAAAPDRLRGIRQITIEHASDVPYRYMTYPPERGIMRRPSFRTGFKHLASRGLTFDATIFHPQLPELAELADAHPDTTIVLNHMGFAMALEMDEEGRAAVFRDWRDGIRELARRPNVVCKVGGLSLPYWGFGFESRSDPVGYLEVATAGAPYVETVIEAFSVDRCLMESNFPLGASTYVATWNALKHIVRSYSDEEKAALFRGTAARVYRINQS